MTDKTEAMRFADGFDLTRRTLLHSLIGMGVGIGTLAQFGEALAQASNSTVRELTIHLQAGLQDICRDFADKPFGKVAPGVKVNYDIGANGITYPKMLAQRSNPVVSGGMYNDIYAQRGIADRMWAKFNPALMPNATNIPKEILTPGGFGLPIHLTPFGIMYNPDRVEKPTSWTDLWNPKYKGRVSMWSAYFDAYIMAAVATGKGPDVEAGIKAWQPHKQNIGAWITSHINEQDLVSRGEIWLAPHWGGWTEQARVQGKNVAFTIPKEGAVQWTGHMQLTAGFSPEATELTQHYLNTWLSDECQVAWAEKAFLSPALSTVRMPEHLLSNPAIVAPDKVTSLVRPDVVSIGPKMTAYKALIDRTLRA